MLDLSGHAVGIGDLEVSSTAIWALDIAATTPVILRISSEGKIVARYELPEYLQREHGLSGIALIDEGDVAVEREEALPCFVLPKAAGQSLLLLWKDTPITGDCMLLVSSVQRWTTLPVALS